MLRNYFKIAIRNLFKYKFYSTLNVLGLSIGITSFLFILLYTSDELNYDRYHPGAERVVRIDFRGRLGESEINTANNPAPLGPTLLEEYPEVETYCRFRDRGSFLVKYEEHHYREENIIFVDSTFFQMFGVQLIQGDPKTVLVEPRSIVLSEKTALRYFKGTEPIGKSMILDNGDSYMVTGIMSETPGNTHFHYDLLVSMSGLDESQDLNWGSFNFNTYVRMIPGADMDNFVTNIQGTFRRGFEPVLRDYVGTTWDEFMAAGNYAYYEFTNLTDIHLHSDRADELEANGDIRYVTIFSLIGFFILLIAGINFVNMATARSVSRAREVGVRKVVGALKSNLVKQFLSESTLIALIALMLSGVILFLLLPSFNELSGKAFTVNEIFSPTFIAIALGIAIMTGLLSGVYPALYLSGFKPVKVLKGSITGHTNKSPLRNGLVVFQFFITTLLIIGTGVVTQQLSYMQNKKLGFEREQVLILNDAYALGDKTESFKQRMLAHPAVKHASISGFLPVESSRNSSAFFKGKNPSPGNTILIGNWDVDFDYVKTMGMEVIHGRDFDPSMLTDSSAILINQELAKQLAYDDPLGQFISGYTGDQADDLAHYQIVGVVGNFHYASLRDNILPLALFINRSSGAISMRLNSEEISPFIADLKKAWSEMAPGQPFEYQFMDERFARMYEAEQRLGRIVTVFAILAIFVACMGLLGLATFIAHQRTKEIGIRKVLGAGIPNLVYLLCKDFGVLILIAFILAVPLGWYVMNNWLEDFAFSTSMGPGVFLLSGILVLLIAGLTIIYQASRVALVDPVETLKWE